MSGASNLLDYDRRGPARAERRRERRDAPQRDDVAFAAALDAIGVGVASISAAGVITGANDAAARLLGLDLGAILGAPIEEALDRALALRIRRMLRDDAVFATRVYGQWSAADQEPGDGAGDAAETLIADQEGRRLSLSVVRRSGSTSGLILIRDIAASQGAAEPGAEPDLRAVRAPLTTVIGYSELLGGAPEIAERPALRRQVQAIAIGAREAADRLEAAIAGETAAAALATGPAAEGAEPLVWTSAAEVLSHAASRAQDAADQAGVKLIADLSDAPRRLITAPSALGAAVSQLLAHAIQYVGEGGRVMAHYVRLDDGGVALELVDDGFGETAFRETPDQPASADRLRLVKTRRDGLDAARKTAERAGASFEYDALPGGGATARLVFAQQNVIDL